MTTTMRKFLSNPSALWRFVGYSLVFGLLSACDGGLIGTGRPPNPQPSYTVRHLPNQVSSDLPSPLVNTESSAPKRVAAARNTQVKKSGAWQKLHEQASTMESLRLEVQEQVILLDSVFDEIQRYCEPLTSVPCQIPNQQITARYTPSIIAALRTQRVDSFKKTQPSADALAAFEAKIEATYQQRAEQAIALPPMTFSRSNGAPFDYQLQRTPSTLLPVTLTLQWNTEKTLSTFQVKHTSVESNHSQQDDIRFDERNDANHTTWLRSLKSLEQDVQFNISIRETPAHRRDREILINSQLQITKNGVEERYSLDGKINDQGGYLAEQALSPDPMNSTLAVSQFNRETFNAEGQLINADQCTPTPPNSKCNEDSIDLLIGTEPVIDSPFYTPEGEIEALTAALGVSVRVENLPPHVFDFEIVSGMPLNVPLMHRMSLCHGIHFNANEQEIFCWAEPSSEDWVVVLSDDGVLRRAHEARIVITP